MHFKCKPFASHVESRERFSESRMKEKDRKKITQSIMIRFNLAVKAGLHMGTEESGPLERGGSYGVFWNTLNLFPE